ncbi:MAG: hypothetical protein IKC38_02415 [Clostridia bacterium]|nr:hypothetical protein [Clostridia bacterium]
MDVLMYRQVLEGDGAKYALLYYLRETEEGYGIRVSAICSDGTQRTAIWSGVFGEYISCLRCLHRLFRWGVTPMGLFDTLEDMAQSEPYCSR